MSHQVGKPLGFVIAPDSARMGYVIGFGGLSASKVIHGSSEDAVEIIDLAERGEQRSTTAISWHMNGVFKNWGMIPPQNQSAAVIDLNGGRDVGEGGAPRRRNVDRESLKTMPSAFNDVDFSYDFERDIKSVDAKLKMKAELRTIDRNLRAAEVELRKYPDLHFKDERTLSDYELVIGEIFETCVRHEDPGIPNKCRDNMPASMKRRHQFVIGMTWRQMGILATKGHRISGWHELEVMDVAEMWAMASARFNLVAQSLEDECRYRDAATFYIESARLIEIASFRVHNLGEKDEGRYSSLMMSGQSHLLLKGYLHAYRIFNDKIGDSTEALRLAILNVRAFTDTGWDPRIFANNITSTKRFGQARSHEQLAKIDLKDFLVEAMDNFTRHHIDPEHMDTESRSLLKEAALLLSTLE